MGALLFFSYSTDSHNVPSFSSFKSTFSTHLPRYPRKPNAKCCLVSLPRHRHCFLGELTCILSYFRFVHSGPDSVSIQVSACFPASWDAYFERLVRVCNSIISFSIFGISFLRDWNEQNASKKDSDTSAATSGARDKRYVILEHRLWLHHSYFS